MSNFAEEVAGRIEDQIDAEFVQRGKALGYDVQPMSQLDRGYGYDHSDDPADHERGGEPSQPSPLDNLRNLPRRDRGNVARARALGQQASAPPPGARRAPSRFAHDEDAAPPARLGRQDARPKTPKRHEIEIDYEDTPVVLRDKRTGSEVTVYVRSVPSTELPYIERYNLILMRLQQQMADITGHDEKSMRRVDRLVDEYNRISEEQTRFIVDMPDGLYGSLNVQAMRKLQKKVAVITAPPDEDDDEDDDPNY